MRLGALGKELDGLQPEVRRVVRPVQLARDLGQEDAGLPIAVGFVHQPDELGLRPRVVALVHERPGTIEGVAGEDLAPLDDARGQLVARRIGQGRRRFPVGEEDRETGCEEQHHEDPAQELHRPRV